MSDIKDSEIYPKLEIRMSPENKTWIQEKLKELKEKFNTFEDSDPKVFDGELLTAALKYGVDELLKREKLKNK